MSTFQKCHDKLVEDGTTYQTMCLAWLMIRMQEENRKLLRERWVLKRTLLPSGFEVFDMNTGKIFRFSVEVVNEPSETPTIHT